jgi:uncharacterized Zn finger protein
MANFKPSKKVKFKCLSCGKIEEIPRDVVEYFDEMDGGDPSVPPRFNCEKCGNLMQPVYYKSVYGYIYKLD